MAQQTKIAWCDATWSPIRGCTRVSPGCSGCYSERLCARNLPGLRSPTTGESFAVMTSAGPRWTGKVELIESELEKPLHWRKPRRIFVCSMSDLFHEALSDDAIDRVFAVMALCPQHIFLVLTKRAKRMWEYTETVALNEGRINKINLMMDGHIGLPSGRTFPRWVPQWPFPHVWLGVTAEDQQRADEQIPWLLRTSAALRFVSAEPMLSDIQLRRTQQDKEIEIDALTGDHGVHRPLQGRSDCKLSLVIAGGETGPGARAMNPEWARRLRDDCVAAGVPFFLKSLGCWTDDIAGFSDKQLRAKDRTGGVLWNHRIPEMVRVGKAAGRLLDGKEWSQMPKVKP